VRFAYADPPYIGQSKRHYADHPDYAGEVDQFALIDRLESEYPDGWALSCGMRDLRALLPHCPEKTRVLSWAKPNASFLAYPNAPNARLFYAWEPVLFRLPCRRPTARVMADWLVASRVQKNASGTRGSKPREFCFWLFDAFGITDADTLDDLFPGSGAVTQYLDEWRRTSTFALASKKVDSRVRQRGVPGQIPIEQVKAS
jgi:hypothetical protein